MTARTLPSQEYLRQCFDYDPSTGLLRWKERPQHHFKSRQSWSAANTKYANTVVGCYRLGYLTVGLNGKLWQVHRVVWKLVYGNEPPEVDHINRVRDDNRLCNLRAADSKTNKHNTASRNRKNRVSALKGVSANWKRWAARIYVDGKTHCLGTYDTPEEAHEAYKRAAIRYHGEFANV